MEFSLNSDRDISFEAFFESQQLVVNLPAGISGVGPTLYTSEQGGMFNFYLSRWTLGIGEGYLSHPIYNLATSSSAILTTSSYSETYLKISDYLIIEGSSLIELSATFRYGGKGSGATNSLDPNSSYGADMKAILRYRTKYTDFGLFSQINVLQMSGTLVTQTSSEVMVGIEMKFGPRYRIPWTAVNHSAPIP
jgi:hypothetical protein